MKWINGFDPKALKIAAVRAEDCKQRKGVGPSELCPEGFEGLPPQQRDILAHGESLYRLQKETAEYRYCFDEAIANTDHFEEEYLRRVDLAERIEHALIPPQLICHDRWPKDFRPPRVSAPPSNSVLELADASIGQPAFTIDVQSRSTEGIVYYLGEIGRCQMKLDPKPVCAPTASIATTYREGAQEDVLFSISRSQDDHVSRGGTASSEVSVSWAGVRYAVAIDPQGSDRSGQVLRVVTQLLALNRSAKDFPTPATVPIISR